MAGKVVAKVIDVDLVRSCLDYDPKTGILTWMHRPLSHFSDEKAYKIWNKRFPGKVAGTDDSPRKGKTGSYRYITLNWSRYAAHRIIWAIVYGESPDEGLYIDHVDGDGTNNRVENLRLVSAEINIKNSRMRPNNSSGINGVYFHKSAGKYCAEGHYTEDGVRKKKYLGVFVSIEEAESARLNWQNSQGGFSERHGK